MRRLAKKNRFVSVGVPLADKIGENFTKKNLGSSVQAAATGAPKRGREETPHVRGQGPKPGGPHARRAAAKRSYPTSEVRGSGREYQTAMVQEPPRGATPHPRSGAEAGRTPCPKGGGQEELPHVQGQGRRPGGATQRLRSGLRREEIPHALKPKARGGRREALPHPP